MTDNADNAQRRFLADMVAARRRAVFVAETYGHGLRRPARLPGGVAAVIEPTSQQCTDNAPIQLDDGQTGYACWYPQMGGYVSHCIVVGAGGGECFEAYVWHDGDFPFSDDDVSPRELHHCDAGQFIRFGEWVQSLGDR